MNAHPGLEDAISLERFATYLAWAGGDRNYAVALYSLNVQLSESLYAPLQMLEIVLRNRIHQVMSRKAGETWIDMPEYRANARQAEMLAKAKQDLADAKKAATPGAIVAALTFGFWTAMLGKEYEDLWQTTLKEIAKREDGKGLQRKDLAAPLAPIRTLRNRIAHHEPILYWNLCKHYDAILQITSWLSPVAAEWCRTHSRFSALYQRGESFLQDLRKLPDRLSGPSHARARRVAVPYQGVLLARVSLKEALACSQIPGSMPSRRRRSSSSASRKAASAAAFRCSAYR